MLSKEHSQIEILCTLISDHGKLSEGTFPLSREETTF